MNRFKRADRKIILLICVVICTAMFLTGCRKTLNSDPQSTVTEQENGQIQTLQGDTGRPVTDSDRDSDKQQTDPGDTDPPPTKPELQPEQDDKQSSGKESAGNDSGSKTEKTSDTDSSAQTIDPDGSYTTKEDVALYLHTYGELPKNYMTKKEAKKLGWNGGNLEDYAPGMCIGGDYFGNYEELLPDAEYHECDIDTLGKKSRGAKRIIWDTDGNIYYTDDHYESFVKLY